MEARVLADLATRLARCTTADRRRLQRRAKRLQSPANRLAEDDLWRLFDEDLRRCESITQIRRSVLGSVSIPAHLPIATHVESILSALESHQVVIVCGDTGSGKSTQLPKICLLAGRGVQGQIVQTQPRRIAARSIARRVSQELGKPLGTSVGYKVRFDGQVRAESSIKIVTDGLLLAELNSDSRLGRYDTVIIDEAHERSLNIDFLLGYLQRLLTRRKDLKVIISSATLDSQRFSEFFNQAPVISVEGRSYPVKIRYQEPFDKNQDLLASVEQALASIALEAPGDTLVFLSGEREIHEVSDHLGSIFGQGMEILPLYSRLTFAQQERIFATHTKPRVVLSTNLAETSLTVPGIRYVIDAGRERVGRYSPGCAVQRLPVEPISKASAAQRAGRCGREAPGICIRLYSELEYEDFSEYQDAEIRRTDLAAVLLRMRAQGVKSLRNFPFIEPPIRRHVNDGLRLLHELDALDEADELTSIGRQLARFPVDPRVGRMLLKAGELNCLAEVLVIAAGLSVADVREHRPGQRGPLPQQLRFEDDRSDFIRMLNIWNYLAEQAPGFKAGKLRSVCQRCRLAYGRVQEWREVHLQLSLLVRDLGLRPGKIRADYAQIHQALLAGLLRNIGQRVEPGEYSGLRGNRFRIARSSGQSRRRPGWVLAAELVDTGQTLAFMSAAIRVKWIERAAGDLLRRGHFDGHWDTQRGEPMIHETTRLYSLTITANRLIRFATVSMQGAREVFIRGALVDGRLDTNADFFQINKTFIEQRREREARARSPDSLISEERLFEFYDARIPDTVCDVHSFEHWCPSITSKDLPSLLLAQEHTCVFDDTDSMQKRYPSKFQAGTLQLALEYVFEPGHENDGIHVTVPRSVLQHLDPRVFEWHVSGHREEKITALLRMLPKAMRRRLGPVPQVTEAFLEAMSNFNLGLYDSLAGFLELRYGIDGALRYWDADRVNARLPVHLMMHFKVIDGAGKVHTQGHNLTRLQAGNSKQPIPSSTFAGLSSGQKHAYRHDDFKPLADQIIVEQAGGDVMMYPALVEDSDGVHMQTIVDLKVAQAHHESGLRRLAIQRCGLDIQQLIRQLPDRQTLCLLYALVPDPIATQSQMASATLKLDSAPCTALCEAVVNVAISKAFWDDGGWSIRDQGRFDTAVESGQEQLSEALVDSTSQCMEILQWHRELSGQLNQSWPQAWQESLDDIREQSRWLVWQGFFKPLPVSA